MRGHHDTFLCRRLAEKLMGWKFLRLGIFGEPLYQTGSRLIDTREFDPCCQPYHTWMLEQEIVSTECVKGGNGAKWTIEKRVKTDPHTNQVEASVTIRPDFGGGSVFSADGHPLYASAVAIDAAMENA